MLDEIDWDKFSDFLLNNAIDEIKKNKGKLEGNILEFNPAGELTPIKEDDPRIPKGMTLKEYLMSDL